MTRTTVCGLLAILGAWAPDASAAEINYRFDLRFPSIEEINDGVPSDSAVLMLFVTTDRDIISVNNLKVDIFDGELFQVPPPFGSDTSPPNPVFLSIRPALAADSWVTTPGSGTFLLGPPLPGDGTTTFGDLTNDGPVTDFQFAQFTLPALSFAEISGRISVSQDAEVINKTFFFYYTLDPEPSSAVLAALGVVGAAWTGRRRLRAV